MSKKSSQLDMQFHWATDEIAREVKRELARKIISAMSHGGYTEAEARGVVETLWKYAFEEGFDEGQSRD
jgi:hypothetical protein